MLNFKFLPIKDLVFSVVPTVGTYIGYIQGISPKVLPNKWIAIGIGLVASVLLALFFYRENVNAYKKSLAEILATGYFMNFTGKLGSLLKSKVPVEFILPDNSVVALDTDRILVEIGIPSSHEALVDYSEEVERKSDIIYVREATQREPFWVRGKLHDERYRWHGSH